MYSIPYAMKKENNNNNNNKTPISLHYHYYIHLACCQCKPPILWVIFTKKNKEQGLFFFNFEQNLCRYVEAHLQQAYI